MVYGKNSHSVENRGSPRKKYAAPTPPPHSPKPGRELARVIYPYEALNEDELSLREGDIITVISKEVDDKGWWKGKLNNKIGVFPDNFVQLINEEENYVRGERGRRSKSCPVTPNSEFTSGEYEITDFPKFPGLPRNERINNNQQNEKWTVDAMEQYMRDQGDTSIRLGLLPSPEEDSGSSKKTFPGFRTDQTEVNVHNQKWTVDEMEKYMRDQGETSIRLGLLPSPETDFNNKRISYQEQTDETPTEESENDQGSEKWTMTSEDRRDQGETSFHLAQISPSKSDSWNKRKSSYEIFPEETEGNVFDVKFKVKAMEKYLREKTNSGSTFGHVAASKTDTNNKRRLFEGAVETEDSNEHNHRWTVDAMENYMRSQCNNSLALGLVDPLETDSSNRRRLFSRPLPEEKEECNHNNIKWTLEPRENYRYDDDDTIIRLERIDPAPYKTNSSQKRISFQEDLRTETDYSYQNNQKRTVDSTDKYMHSQGETSYRHGLFDSSKTDSISKRRSSPGVLQEKTDYNNQRNQNWSVNEMEKNMRDKGETSIRLGQHDPPSSGTNSSNRTRHFTGETKGKQQNQKWTVDAMEKYMRDQGDTSIHLGLIEPTTETISNSKNKYSPGVSPKRTEKSNQQNQKWTVDAMEKYMRDQGETSIHLGLIEPPESEFSNKRSSQGILIEEQCNNQYNQQCTQSNKERYMRTQSDSRSLGLIDTSSSGTKYSNKTRHFSGVAQEKKGINTQHNQKWTVEEMEKYIRNQGETSYHLGLVGPPETDPSINNRSSLGAISDRTNSSKQHNQKWTVEEMEKYIRDQGETSYHLGLVGPPETDTSNSRGNSLGVLQEETENNQHNQKWTVDAMEKYMRDQGETTIRLGLVEPQPTENQMRSYSVQSHK